LNKKEINDNLFSEKYFYFKNDKDKRFLIKSVIPLKKNKKLPVILLLHGMNSLGINDPRILHLVKSLSILGYNVITPEILEIKNFLINQDTLKSLDDFFEIFKSNIFYGKIGLFLISFSAGMGLISISNQKYKNVFKSTFCIGSYSNFETSISYTLNNFEHNNYGGYILLYNYIDLIVKNNKIKNYFYDNIIYNGQKIDYLRIKNNLSKHEISFCDKIEKDFSFRLEIGEEIIKKKKDIIKKLSPINNIYQLDNKNKLFLLHGKNDKIISSQESIYLYDKIKDNKTSKLLVTDLINHVSTSKEIKKYLKLPELISFFDDFLFSVGG
jgi:hypothetical protein